MRIGNENFLRPGKSASRSDAKLSNNNYMNNQNSYLNLMLDSNKSNPKSIRHPFYKMMDEKAKKDSKKIDDANKNLMKDVNKDLYLTRSWMKKQRKIGRK